ncbi:hypothetical protein GCM10010252_76920 [Streptomyces aureoverticillatus]|nr:hypothetical protein GCM10010252_76920 [Streptomyces aureoverticillatus]
MEDMGRATGCRLHRTVQDGSDGFSPDLIAPAADRVKGGAERVAAIARVPADGPSVTLGPVTSTVDAETHVASGTRPRRAVRPVPHSLGRRPGPIPPGPRRVSARLDDAVVDGQYGLALRP